MECAGELRRRIEIFDAWIEEHEGLPADPVTGRKLVLVVDNTRQARPNEGRRPEAS